MSSTRQILGGYIVKVVSKDGAARVVERIDMTKEQKQRLTLNRLPNAVTKKSNKRAATAPRRP